ncbi:MAG: valine--tRNA ligase [Candidatus Portnoybacteria bacterium]|nr:valine--tRNA ligase [Candidatus Portnoybacteria bacterium]
MEIPKAYDPKQVENKIYNLWEKGKFFAPRGKGKPFVITIPPPNITGSLHMGHALNNTIQDVMIRYYRMKQVPSLWIPGTDHAGIATQNKVEKELKKQGLSRYALGKEKFIERVWQWKEKYGNEILNQLKKLGCSCDWSRLRFTLDKEYSKAVETAFLHYYKKGWIYQGPRIVNWCQRCTTAISDIEIKHVPHKTKLWYIKYPLAPRQARGDHDFIVVATTRPETMLGDTAVAVNPKDARYKNLVGEKVILPLIEREIPIIADRLIDIEFGTGAVKVTPAHNTTDNKIGKTHKLESINVIGEDGRITKNGGKYADLKILEARNKIIEDLRTQNLLEKEEDYEHSLAICDRCETPIEPLISKQWFLKMDKLAKPAIDAVKKGKIEFTPARYKKIYLDWLDKAEDWCISRQLWWGHKIPLAGENDVLDTWFSSALWPFAILGWPLDYAKGKPRKNSDLEKFYPTSLLITAQDIIYLWVARMIFSSLEFLKTIPFKNVYINATVLNIEGKRMSKSLGTGLDPNELIEKYGADATRFGLLYQTGREQQAIKFSEDTIKASRNFCNKIWNINRFIHMKPSASAEASADLTPDDKRILKRLDETIKSITRKIENYELGESARELYEFVWHEYADKYIETSKKQEKNVNVYVFRTILRLLHPFIPFVTESIWQMNYKEKKPLIISEWPTSKK